MVKAGGESPGEAVSVSSHSTQPPRAPEWSFPLFSRPKTKRVGTPFPERARRELKRAGLETISGISRIKKKMVFEMAEELLAGKNGEGTAPPEGEHPTGAPMKRALAQMARPGPFEAATGHLLLLDQERCFAVGISDDDLVEPPASSCFREVEELKEESTPIVEEDLKENNDSQGAMSVRPISEQPEVHRGFSGERNEDLLLNGHPTMGGTMGLTCGAGTTLTPAGNNLEASAISSTKKDGQQQLLETKVHAWPISVIVDKGVSQILNSPTTFSNIDGTYGQMETNQWSAHLEASGYLGPHACDTPKEKESHQLLGVHACESTITAKDNNHANLAFSHNFLSPRGDGEQPVLVGEAAPEVGAAEHSPELRSPPATVQQLAENPLPKQQADEKPGIGSSGTNEEGDTASGEDDDRDKKADPKDEPINLNSSTLKGVGTAGNCEGVPSLSFSNEETKLLADKIGHAIVGKFSHSIPSAHQIQKTLSNIHFVDGFKWKFMNAKHILIQFRDVRDYAMLLNGPNGAPVWYVDSHPMRVFKWTPDFDTFFESPIVAVWCKLIGIPIHLYELSALLAIGKLLGKPIQADHATINQTRLTFARICVEIDISQPPPEEIILNILGKDTRYKVVWDRIPAYCVECKHVGHFQEECLVLGKKKVPMKDHNHDTNSRRTNSRRNHIRREWRPKGSKTDDPNRQPDHPAASKEELKRGPPEESKEADASTSLKATKVTQVHVDEDGFQLVTSRKKGKMNFPLHHPQEGPHKAPYLEKLLMGGNVATVSFKDTDMGVIDPGGSSTVCIS